jgi:translation elongation factor EF-G
MVFEPIQKVEIKVPSGMEGAVIKVLTGHRGQIGEIIPEGAFARVKGKLPASETIDIADEWDEFV